MKIKVKDISWGVFLDNTLLKSFEKENSYWIGGSGLHACIFPTKLEAQMEMKKALSYCKKTHRSWKLRVARITIKPYEKLKI